MNVLFLAAGLGTRLQPLTLKYPKPCVPFLNVPMGLYPFRFLNQLPVNRCVVNTFHLPQQIQALYQTQPFYQKSIHFSDEHPHILGSAGGLKKASQHFSSDETILMLNADEVFFPQDPTFLQQAYQQHLKNNNLATLVVMKHPEAGKKFGAIWCDNKQVCHIGKQSHESALQPWHYIGMIFLNRKILSMIPDNQESNIFYDILIQHLSQTHVQIFPIECRWYETGNPQDYLQATHDVLKNLDTATLEFINGYDPSELIQNPDGSSLVSKAIHVSVEHLLGYNVIAKNSSPRVLNSLSRIENAVIFQDDVLNLSYFS